MNADGSASASPGSCPSAASATGSVSTMLGDLQGVLSARADAEVVALRDLVAALEKNSFPVLLLLFSLLLVSPLSALPGATSLFGLTTAAIAAQQLVGRRQVWLPAILLDRPLPARRTEQALHWLRRPVGWVEGRLRQRHRWVFVAPVAHAPMTLVLLAGLCAPLMEVIPASGTSVGAAISAYSAGLLARDGLFVLAGAGLAAVLPISLWLLIT
jgi:hypothetical protein